MVHNNIEVMAIPVHTSHVMQPLYSMPFANFKMNWNQNLIDYLFTSVDCNMPKQEFLIIIWPAWKKSMTTAIIKSGFNRTGIFSD